MGRRKIAIQPITNDRTRSVTFLKRKTGLFKKAYELGVLCSVDVAVIIFERKPGHPDKLFQYCSTDINALVQRQVRFDGERDLRTPQDFSGTAGAPRMDDMGDDDDDGDADDSPSQYLRHDSLKAKSEPESSQVAGQKLDTAELDYRSHLHLPGSLPTTSPTLPVSADRHTRPHPSGSRVLSSSSPYTTQSPVPRKRIKVDDRSRTVTSPVSGTFTPRSDSDASLSSRTVHSRSQQPPPPLPPPPYQQGFFPGFGSHVSPTAPPGSGSSLHMPASFQPPTAGGSLGAPPLHLLSSYGSSSRHPPRISQHHFGPNPDDLFANVFGPAGSGGFAPTTQAAGGNGQQGGHSTGDSSSTSWLDFLSGAAPDAPRSPRPGKRSRGDAAGGAGEDGTRGPASGSG